MRRCKISLRNYGVIAISMIALVKPDSLEFIGLGWLDTFLIIFDVGLLLWLLLEIEHYCVSKQTFMIIIMYLVLALSTVIHQGDYLFLIKTIGPTTACCLYTDYCMQKGSQKYIKTGMIVWEIVLTLNLISIVLFPQGLYTNARGTGACWLLGFDNGFIYYLLPSIGYAMLYSKLYTGRIHSIHVVYNIVIAVMTELLVWSASGIVMLFVMLFCILANDIPLVKRLVKPSLLIGAFFIATYLVVFLRVIDKFEPLIVNVLHKDITLTGRTTLWDYAISVIKENLFLGIGQGGYTVIGRYNSYLHPHSLVLDLLYKGGVIMFGLFCFILYRFSNFTTKYLSMPSAKIILMVVASILFGEVANSTQYKPFFWSFTVMAFYIPQLSGYKADKKEFIHFGHKTL